MEWSSTAWAKCVLDQLSSGVIVCLADLSVLALNKMATLLIDAASTLTILDRRLVCMDGHSQKKLEQRMRFLTANESPPRRSVAMRVARAGSGTDLQLQIVPLPISRAANEPEISAYCIWVFDFAASKRIDTALLRELHGLTVTESAVATGLFGGRSLEEVAAELQVTVNTIKTHLKHIFQKCEVRSQAELLQMLALGPRGI